MVKYNRRVNKVTMWNLDRTRSRGRRLTESEKSQSSQEPEMENGSYGLSDMERHSGIIISGFKWPQKT